ncbi:MAG: hypothetical protein JNM24_20090 [Bdellovibrionaceae bacterium]|nr:hypothetical protein [Pseudobdellovibrionaceae bacterium]
MRTGKILICDGILALMMIVAMSSCEQFFNTHSVVTNSREHITTLASLYKKL